MKTFFLLAVGGLLLGGCATGELDTAAGNTARVATYPVTAPARVVADSLPLSVQTEYVYWKPVPGTSVFTKIVTQKALTIEEQRVLGIPVPEDAKK
ncbi:MAG: hypothetical protein LBS59_04735 [Puniceicoccales bacterium]|nr:hypothetical protein [Puniceicoccales bacterium]